MTTVSDEFLARCQRYPEITTNIKGSFVNGAYVLRLLELIRDVVTTNQEHLTQLQLNRLTQLADDLVADAIIPLPSDYPDESCLSPTSAHWETLLAGKGHTWQSSPWFLNEQYLFHLILLIVGYYSAKIDPFRP